MKIPSWILPILAGALLLGIWYTAGAIFANLESAAVRRVILPFPHEVFGALLKEWPTLSKSIQRTSTAALVGFAAAVGVGYTLSLLLGSAKWVKDALYPWVLVVQMTPVVVLAPIFVIWMGEGLPSITAITFMIGFFPVVANTTMGFVSTERSLLDLFEMNNATRMQTLLHLRIPFAMPYFLTGMKIAGTLAPIGAIAGDLFAGGSVDGVGGIGYMVISYNSQLLIPELFATALVACLLGFVFVGAVNWLHWYLLKDWHDSVRKTDQN